MTKQIDPSKFKDLKTTAKGETRAWITLNKLETLWFNTGTLCNLECSNCYIESSPKNDRLVYITKDDVLPYLDEIKEQNLGTKEIAFTGGEPFLNPHMLEIIELCLERGFQTLVLTNAHKVINKPKMKSLTELSQSFPNQLVLRVSLDHYAQELHEKERGPKTFHSTLKTMQELAANNITLAIAGRTLSDEDQEAGKQGYKNLMNEFGLNIPFDNPYYFMIFPEMDEQVDVPEITTQCWSILNKNPDDIMCASSRMIVKRKGEDKAKVLACTLLAYDKQFELGETLESSDKDV